ncbi:MAG: heterodisulfide reductase-related iron-sulfur binding cluster [Gammaproteobacteria bacterium]|nr:heterodisulfide reductase-related iron-sulfur binding cluster [Gammaproteobacteria bacterium]
MATREGSLDAPTRHPLDWQSPDFWSRESLEKEMERVFDICHGCRRCFNLCNAFPTLFDAVDESSTGEVDGVPKSAFAEIVNHCYLCDMCYLSKCPYVPPHPFNVDFPHLMLRAKAVRFKEEGAPLRSRILSATDQVGSIAGIPVVAEVVNAFNDNQAGRLFLEKTLGVARDAPLPRYESDTARKRLARQQPVAQPVEAVNGTSGKVILYTTCYGNRNLPGMVEDLVAVFRHNGITVQLAGSERCCGMPKLELGDLDSVAKAREANVPGLAKWVADGWDIVAPVPSCVLMFKQELPLMFPKDEQVQAVGKAFFDPFNYLYLRHKGGKLRTEFATSLGTVSYHVPCHLRVQNIGLKTRDVLQLVPGTTVDPIERCSGHDGTYGVKKEYRAASVKIARPVAEQVEASGADHFCSDCPMAGAQVAGLANRSDHPHPIELLRRAYGI